MTRSHQHPGATAPSRPLTSILFAVSVLASALLGAAAASAAVPDAGSVAEAAIDALPGRPLPVETPNVPKVPAPVSPSSISKAPSSASAPSAPADAPVQGLVRGAREGAEAVARALPEAGGPDASAGPGARSEPGKRAVARGPDRRSIGRAETAPLRRWRAYVWPAIALRVEDALIHLLARVDGFVGVHVPDDFGLLFPPTVPSSVGIELPSERPGLPSRDLQSPSETPLPEGGMGLLAALLIGLLMAVGLVALARLVVGEELFETRHWWNHRG